ncbi:MAG: zf-HC2 domain-containing protein [Acidobacteriota bacterium]|nr:MAG: zf-HC2 domain-containing protein [Acidobacteriota bacterium]
MSRECDRFIELIKDELAGELDQAEASRLEEHLTSCGSCRNEKAVLEKLLLHMRAVEEEPVPRHFFVYEERKASIWESLKALLFGWNLAAAGSVAAAMILAVLLLSQVTLTYGEGTFAVSFGGRLEKQATEADLKQLREELLGSFRQIAQEENASVLESLRSEWRTSLVKFGEESQVQLEQRVGAMEQQVGLTIDRRNARLQRQMESTIGNLGNLLIAQHESDMRTVRQQLNQSANFNRIQANQTDAIVATLVQLADATTR